MNTSNEKILALVKTHIENGGNKTSFLEMCLASFGEWQQKPTEKKTPIEKWEAELTRIIRSSTEYDLRQRTAAKYAETPTEFWKQKVIETEAKFSVYCFPRGRKAGKNSDSKVKKVKEKTPAELAFDLFCEEENAAKLAAETPAPVHPDMAVNS